MIVTMSDLQDSSSQIEKSTKDIFTDVKYICNSTSLIVDALQNGLDVAQLTSGDVIITEVKTVHTHYSWNESKQKMVRIRQT